MPRRSYTQKESIDHSEYEKSRQKKRFRARQFLSHERSVCGVARVRESDLSSESSVDDSPARFLYTAREQSRLITSEHHR